MTGASTYSSDEVDALARWLRDGASANELAALFTDKFRAVSRSAMIGLVHRHKTLRKIGFARRTAVKDRAAPSAATQRSAMVNPYTLPGRLKASMVAASDVDLDMGAWAAHPGKARQQRGSCRTVDDMIAGLNAPIPLGAPLGGKTLAQCPPRGCRFPVGTHDGQTTFCAVAVEAWAPGTSSGCYCNFHRRYLSGCASVADDEAA